MGCMPCWNNHILGGRHLPGLWLPTEEQVQGERCHCGGQEQKPLHHLQGGPVKLLSQKAKPRSCGWGGAGFVWGWLAQRAGQGVQSGCRVRNGLSVKPPELLGGFWDGQSDSSTWVSPMLVPELPSLGWMRVRPRDSAVPRGTTHPNTPPRAPPAPWHPPWDPVGCPQQRGEGGTCHVDQLEAITWDLDKAGP